MPEQVLVVSKYDFPDLPKFVPLNYFDKSSFFMDRDSAENCASHWQIIPYITFIDSQMNVLVYQRGEAGGERRLHGKKSLGFGGHINPVDTGDNTVFEAMKRELMEELPAYADKAKSLIYNPLIKALVIRSEETPVDKVHLGLSILIYQSSEELLKLAEQSNEEEGIDRLKVVSVYDIQLDELETWSKYVLDSMQGVDTDV